jgi:uncharacterized phage protein gp47/JayE
VTFTARTYDDIVRDMLTTLTGGTVRETALVPAVSAGAALIVPLKNHPVRRVSFAEGQINITVTKPDKTDPTKKVKSVEARTYRFTAADFDLISTKGDDNDKDAIRFRDKGQKPIAATDLVVNYYPVQTEAVPLNDVMVGSVIRSIVETIGIELALTYQQLEQVYKSAFVDTAEGDALDKVVSLVGVQRMPSGRAVATLRFTRDGTAGSAVTIPLATPVTDNKGNRYLTTAEATMAPAESTREVTAAAESTATPEVAENTLKFLEVAISGISTVTNPAPSRKQGATETDDQLRTRARAALRTTMHGTVDAIRFGLMAIHGVKDVKVTEQPGGAVGKIRVDVAYSDNSPDVKAVVAERLDELRPAGIVVESGEAAKLQVAVKVSLTLAGASMSGADLQALTKGAGDRLEQLLSALPPEGKVRLAAVTAAVMSDTRIVDAKITFTANGTESDALTLPAQTVLDLVTPIVFDSPEFEQKTGAPQLTSTVSMSLPLNLVGTTTQADAQAVIEQKAAAYLATIVVPASLTFAGLATAIRDDTHFALVRADAMLTVEGQGGLFRQLTDELGSYAPGTNEKLVKGTVVLDVRGHI